VAYWTPPALGSQADDWVGVMTVAWPPDTRLLVNVVVNFEEGAERNLAAGDTESESMSEPTLSVGAMARDLMAESVHEFGARRGVWRVLDVLDDAAIPATVFACGRAVEVSPEITAAFVERGFDFVGHGYLWAPSALASFREIREDIRHTRSVIEAATGTKMLGWFSRSPVGPATRIVAAAEGLKYDSMSCGDDRPSFVNVGGQPFLIIPYTTDVNDIRFWRGNFHTGDEFADYGRDTFDQLNREATAEVPLMMTVGVHPKIIGRPGRIHGLARLIDHILSSEGAWVTRRQDIAARWLDSGPIKAEESPSVEGHNRWIH
jgi:allantoinase